MDRITANIVVVIYLLYVYFYIVLLQVPAARVHLVVKQLQEQLDQAQARIRTLEAGLQNGAHSVPSKTHQSKQSLPVVRVVASISKLVTCLIFPCWFGVFRRLLQFYSQKYGKLIYMFNRY